VRHPSFDATPQQRGQIDGAPASNSPSSALLIFDMDGVLVDVTESYRETISRTVEHFTGRGIGAEAIQEYKNQGGWNDDWQLSHHIVRAAGVTVSFEEVKAHFQKLFHGENGTAGLMLRERWIARPGLLENLHRQFRFALFTGRPKDEAQLTLDRFARRLLFDPIVGMHEVANHKPAPDGLLQIVPSRAQGVPHEAAVFYIGDTVDDARAARAAAVPFIGIAAAENLLRASLVALFQAEGARAILADINQLPEALGQ
jgi:HAD superfamily phosphatase